MSQSLEKAVIRILNQQQETVGTGFLIADRLAVTCAHVVEAARPSTGNIIQTQFLCDPTGTRTLAMVCTAGWSPANQEDIAFLELKGMAAGAVPLKMMLAKDSGGHRYTVLGYPRSTVTDYRIARDEIVGLEKARDGHTLLLHLKGNEITYGMSGGPVLDETLDRVVGMITKGQDDTFLRFAYATPTETLVKFIPLPPATVAAMLEPVQAPETLNPILKSLEAFIKERTEGFVGREYVFQAIATFLERNPNGYLTILGDPGIGKSTLLAEYVRRENCIAHFNIRAQRISSTAQFIETVCPQIIARFHLPYAGLPPGANQTSTFLEQLLLEASQQLGPGKRLVIAVDALDEVDLPSPSSGENVLLLPHTLPERVYFIMTRRNVEIPFDALAPQEELDLMAHPAENRRDVENYLRKNAERPKIRAWIQGQAGLTTTAFVDTLAEKSESNFMYLRWVLLDIEKGAYQNLRIESLPVGLERYYETHWRMMGMAAKPRPELKIKIIYILSEVKLPVSRQFLHKLINHSGIKVNEPAIQDVIDEWDQFLHKEAVPGGTRYSIYHASFRDFLNRKEIIQSAGITIQDINALIANSMHAPLEDALRRR